MARDLLAAKPAAGPRDLLASRKGDRGAAPLPGAQRADAPAGETQTAAQHYQTWPERLIRAVAEAAGSGFRLPHDVMQGEDPSTSRVVDLATMGLGASAARGSGKLTAQLSKNAVVRPAQTVMPPATGPFQAYTIPEERFFPGRNPLVRGPSPAAKKPMQQTVEAFDRSGVEPTLPMVTESKALGTSARVLGNTIIGGRLAKGVTRATEQAGQRVETLAGNRSPVANAATAGERVIQGVKDFEKAGDIKKSGLYAAVENQIAPEWATRMRHTQKMVNTLDRAIENPEFRAFLTDPNLQETYALLRSAGQQGVSFKDLQAVRSKIGTLQASADSKVGINKRGLKALYGSMTKDLEEIARESGGEIGVSRLRDITSKSGGPFTADMEKNARIAGGNNAVRALKDADSYTRALEAVRLPEVKNLLGKSGEDVFREIGRLAREKGGADWKRLAQIKRSVGEQAWNDVKAITVRELGRKGDIPFDPDTFIKNYAGQQGLSPKGNELLLDKNLRAALDDLELVSRGVSRASGSSGMFGGHRLSVANVVTGGVLGPALFFAPKLLALAVPPYLLVRTMTTPSIVRWLSGVTRARGNPGRLNGLFREIDRLSGGDKEMGDVLRRIGAAALNDREDQPAAGNPTVVGGKPPR